MALNTAVAPNKDDSRSDNGTEDVDSDLVFDGPTENRQCRDVVVLVIFVLCIGGLGFVVWRAASLGNPFRLVYGTDSWGNICNLDNIALHGVTLSGQNAAEKPFVFYFNDEAFSVASATVSDTGSVRLCVKTCPTEVLSTVSHVTDFHATTGSRLCRYDVAIGAYHDGQSDGLGTCPPLPIAKHEVFLQRCVPAHLIDKVTHLLSAVHSLFNVIDNNFLEKAAEDIRNTWQEVLWLCALAVFVGLTLVVLLQFLAGVIVWLIVVGLMCGSVAATVVCWYRYSEVRNGSDAELSRNWLIGSVCVTVGCVVLFLILLVIRKYIQLTMFWLVVSFGVLTLVFLFIETAGVPTVDDTTGFVGYQEDNVLQVLKWFFILMSLWILQFVIACHHFIIAGAVSTWYFTRDKSDLSFPVLTSVRRLFRYHLGSIAIGSLLVAIVQLIRIVLSFIENRDGQRMDQNGIKWLKGRSHPLASFLLKCLACCFWCFEKFLKFINTNAYIEIAIFGYGFCKAARQAFLIIVHNALRLAAINSVGEFVLFLGKVATVAVVVVAGIELISVRRDTSYPWLPVTLAAIFAFFIASCFMSVYEMTIDTIFICFCEDCRINDGGTRPFYMSTGLRNCVSAGLTRGRPILVMASNSVRPAVTTSSLHED